MLVLGDVLVGFGLVKLVQCSGDETPPIALDVAVVAVAVLVGSGTSAVDVVHRLLVVA